jgi:hypothetical protein
LQEFSWVGQSLPEILLAQRLSAALSQQPWFPRLLSFAPVFALELCQQAFSADWQPLRE